MRKKIFFVCMCMILCVIFFRVVDSIEERQTKVIMPGELSANSLKEELGEGKRFEEFLVKEDFGEFYELEMSDAPKEPEIANGSYYSADLQLVQEVVDILSDYEYYQSEGADDLYTEDGMRMDFRLRGRNNTDLRMLFYTVDEESDLIVMKVWAEDFAHRLSNGMSTRWLGMTFYVDYAVLDRIITCMKENYGTMSLELARQTINSADTILSSCHFFCMKNEFIEDYSNFETEDHYNIYTQSLSDYQGYLQLYEVYKCSSGVHGVSRDRFIFKIELYDNEGNFQEELYLNMEAYNRALGKGETG